MLSYQHIYHAGNHADVLKHLVLVFLLRALQRKETPIRVFDTHAGSGRYDLSTPEARRNAEYELGIGRVLEASRPPRSLEPYLRAVRACNGRGPLRRYPGSPWLAHHLLRGSDHLALMELHPRALTDLRDLFRGDRKVHIHARDAFEALPALLPPPERRGVVLIDPAYESKEEYPATLRLLQRAYRRWPGGVYAIWYPLIEHPAATGFVAAAMRTGIPRMWHAELRVRAPQRGGLLGSGLVIVNLPWQLDNELTKLLPWLWQILSEQGAGGWHAGWLMGETNPLAG